MRYALAMFNHDLIIHLIAFAPILDRGACFLVGLIDVQLSLCRYHIFPLDKPVQRSVGYCSSLAVSRTDSLWHWLKNHR